MAGSSWPTLTPGTKARASDVEAKFDWIEGAIVPMNAGSTTDAAYDLGTTAARWRTGYFSDYVYANSGVGIGIGASTPSATLQTRGTMLLEATSSAGFTFRRTTYDDILLAHYGSGWAIRNATDGRNDILINTDGTIQLSGLGAAVNEFSTDDTMAGDSDQAVPTEQAVKGYVDTQIGATDAKIAIEPSTSAIRVYFDSATSAALTLSQTAQKIWFNMESYDYASEYDNSTNYRFTANSGGLYDIFAAVDWQGGSTAASIGLIIRKNGSATTHYKGDYVYHNVSNYTVQIHDTIYLASTDYVEIFAGALSGYGSTITVNGIGYGSLGPSDTSPSTYLTIRKVR